jgi:protein pelota
MNIIEINKNLKKIVFVPQNLEDLWTIKSIINIGDIIKGQSYRRQTQEESKKSERKHVFISLNIEKYSFSSQLNSLRLTGIIKESKPSELAPLGDHHTIEIELHKKYTLFKKELFKYQIELLKNSSKFSNKILLVALDMDFANIFSLNNISYNEITKIYSGKSGKQYKSNFNINRYLEDIYKVIENKDFDQIIVAGPGFTKNKLYDFLKSKINKVNILKLNMQNISKSSINELFLKPEVKKFFENSIIYKEEKLFNKFLENLGKANGLSLYGLEEIKLSINIGACKNILILEDIWTENIDEIQLLIKNAEKINCNVHIVDNKHPISKKLKSFGGVIAILRFRI